MSKPLKIGDRVRVVGYEHQQPTDAQHARILRGEEIGTIQGLIISRVSVRFGNRSFSVPTWNIERITLRRTFEEIVNELAAKLPKTWRLVGIEKSYAEFETNSTTEVTIWRNGNVAMDACIGAAEFAAISAACTEIAANYAAEHGKKDE